MPSGECPSRFADLLGVDRIGPSNFRGPALTNGPRRSFGGLTIAQAITAVGQTWDQGRRLSSFHATFVGPGNGQCPTEYVVDALADTNTRTLRTVQARQDGRLILHATVSATRPHIDQPDLQEPAPDVPPPSDCRAVDDVLASISGQSSPTRYAELRQLLDLRAADSSSSPDLSIPRRWWQRSHHALGDTTQLHAAVIAYMSDLTILTVALRDFDPQDASKRMASASLDHAIWIHREFRADDWLLFDQSPLSTSLGRSLTCARVFDASGRRVATITQEGLIRQPL